MLSYVIACMIVCMSISMSFYALLYVHVYIYISTGYLGPQPTTGPPGKYLIFPKIVIKPPREYADRKLSMKQVKKNSIANIGETGVRKEGLQKGVSQKFNESAVLEVH